MEWRPLRLIKRIISAFPDPPARRYDLITEAMLRPFGSGGGRGPVRAGAIERPRGETSEKRSRDEEQSRANDSPAELRENEHVGVDFDADPR
jgi:hypothetical protein